MLRIFTPTQMTRSKRSRRRAGKRALSAWDAEVAKLGRALSARDAEVAKLGKENGELKGENEKLKEQACGKAHGGGPCPYAEENKRLKEDLVQARKINSAVSARLIGAKPNVRAKKGEAKKGEAKKGEAKKGGGARKIREEPDRIVEVDPRACQDCSCGLAGIEGRCSRTVKRLKIGTEIVRYSRVNK